MTASTRRAAIGAILAAPLASVPAIAATEYADHRAILLHAWEEARLAEPFADARPNSLEERARSFVMARLWQLCGTVIQLPAPKTLDGAVVFAMAACIMWEGENPSCSQEKSVLAVIRAVLAASATKLPDGFVSFGDDPNYWQDVDTRQQSKGQLPAWAIARAEAKLCA